jgi:Arc/MetJ-type ribon-helix-helix transcriptional regulator
MRSIQIAVRLPDEAVEFVDSQVSSGAAKSRADFIWRAIKREQRRLEAEHDLQILIEQPYDEFDEMHQSIAGRGHPKLD